MHSQSETFVLLSAPIRHLFEMLLQQGCRRRRPCCSDMRGSKAKDEHVAKSKLNNFLPGVMLLLTLLLAMAIDNRDSEAILMHPAGASAGVSFQ